MAIVIHCFASRDLVTANVVDTTAFAHSAAIHPTVNRFSILLKNGEFLLNLRPGRAAVAVAVAAFTIQYFISLAIFPCAKPRRIGKGKRETQVPMEVNGYI